MRPERTRGRMSPAITIPYRTHNLSIGSESPPRPPSRSAPVAWRHYECRRALDYDE